MCITYLLLVIKRKKTTYSQPVRLLVSASPNQPANSVFLSQKTSTSQPKPAPASTSEQAHRSLTWDRAEVNYNLI